MQVLVDNVLVGEPTVQDGFSNSFAFAVNEGSVVDMNYLSEFSGWPGNFEVVDAEGTVLFDSDASANSSNTYGSAAGVYGLRACAAEPECSRLKVSLYSQYQGWDLASLFVYDGPVLADAIGGYWFNGKTLIGYVDIEVGESVDFQVNGGFYPAEYSYKVEDEEGNVIVDQVEAFEPAEDVLDVVICTLSEVAETGGLAPVQLVPNPSDGQVQLVGLAPETSWTLSIRNLLGQEVFSQQGQGQRALDLAGLPAGTYLAGFTSASGAWLTWRVVLH